MFIKDESYLTVIKTTYTLTLGELDFEDLNTTKFMIFVVYTTLITLVLMNLLIAILSDAYELVQAEKKYYDGKAKLSRTLMYERIAIFFMRLLKREPEQEDQFLFISMPLNYEEDPNLEDEGMIGKLLNDSKKNQIDTNTRFEENKKRNEEIKKEINEKINASEVKVEKRIDDLS